MRSLLVLLACLIPSLGFAAGAPSDAEMIALFNARKADFEKLRTYLIQTNTKVFGPRYGEYLELRKSLGVKRFYVTDRGQPAFRLPVYVAPPWTRFTAGLSKGYAWLPPTKDFPHYPGEVFMVDPSEPKTQWLFGNDLSKFSAPSASSAYVVLLRKIEGDWYIFADNNPYRKSW